MLGCYASDPGKSGDQYSRVTTDDEDAAGIVAMLDAAHVTWADLDVVYGDKPAEFRDTLKSNQTLMAAIARQLRVDVRDLNPQPKNTKGQAGHGKGSYHSSNRALHRLLLTPGAFHVHSRARHLQTCMQKWDGKLNSKWKHAIDALKYGLDDLIYTPKPEGRSRAWSVR